MDKIWTFTTDPSVENYEKIRSSKLIRKSLGEIYSTWKVCTLLKFYDDADWSFIKKSKNELKRKYDEYDEEIKEKILKQPRLNLLNKVWGMYYGTKYKVYLDMAISVIENDNAKASTQDEARRLYKEANTYYCDAFPITNNSRRTHHFNIPKSSRSKKKPRQKNVKRNEINNDDPDLLDAIEIYNELSKKILKKVK